MDLPLIWGNLKIDDYNSPELLTRSIIIIYRPFHTNEKINNE